jgi:hypothetical protein
VEGMGIVEVGCTGDVNSGYMGVERGVLIWLCPSYTPSILFLLLSFFRITDHIRDNVLLLYIWASVLAEDVSLGSFCKTEFVTLLSTLSFRCFMELLLYWSC